MVARRQGDLVLIKPGNDAMPRRAVGGEPRLRAMLSMNMFYAASEDGKLDKALDSLVCRGRGRQSGALFMMAEKRGGGQGWRAC